MRHCLVSQFIYIQTLFKITWAYWTETCTPNLSIKRSTGGTVEYIPTLENTSQSGRYGQALDLLATWPLRSTRNTWCLSSESTLHYKHRLDYVFPNRLSVSNHSAVPLNAEYSPYVWTGGLGRLVHALSDAGPPGDWYTRLTGRGIKRTEGGKRKKEKCLLNDIPIVRQSRTMALCKTVNNEHRRNPLSYRGPAACLPLP